MSATAEFTSPNVEAQDYYERLGAPADASADDIANHTKKYVAKFKPELSDHDNADERWDRFNDARQTLSEPDDKGEYDTFRERFGPEDGAEAFEAWEARDRPGDPATLDPARQLDRPSIGNQDGKESADDTSARQTNGRDTDGRRRSQSQQQQESEAERRRRRQERRRRRQQADIDLDASKAYSTRNVSQDEEEVSVDDADEPTARWREVLTHLRESGRVATREVATLLGMIELAIVGYLAYVVVVEVGAGTVADAVGATIVQDLVTVGAVLGIGFVLVTRYLQRFVRDAEGRDGRRSLSRRLITESDNTRWFVYSPTVAAVLFAGLLMVGGGGTTLLLLGLSVLFTYGRYRVVSGLVPTPDWSRYIELAGGVGAALLFVAVFALSTPGVGVQVGLAAGPMIAVVVFVLTIALAGLPTAALRLGASEQ